jgi:hypothetical protein
MVSQGLAAFVQDDLSSTTQNSFDQETTVLWNLSNLGKFQQIESNPAVLVIGNWVDLASITSTIFSLWPNNPDFQEIETWVDLSVAIAPKEVRNFVGVVVEERRASFRTAFADELID